MAADSRYSQVLNVKRKLYSWVMSFLGESKDTASESTSGKQLVPDAKDIVGILKSTGFRLVDVTMGQYGAGATNNALCCRVIVTCAKSGLSAVLESEAECRCPEDAMGDGASAWCVMSPSGSQECLDKSWNVTASSLMPNVASHVAEVVGAATRFLVQLLEDKGLATPGGGFSASGRAARARGAAQDLTRTPGGPAPSIPPLPSAPSTGDTLGSITPGRSHPVWLEGLEWEMALQAPIGMDTPLPDISGLSLSGSQSFSRAETQLPQVGVIGPPRRQSSTLEDYALQGTLPSDVEAKVVFDEHMRLTEQTRVLRSPSYALGAAADAQTTSQTASISTTVPLAVAATTTITTNESAATAAASVSPGIDATGAETSSVPAAGAANTKRTQASIENASIKQQANTAVLLPRRAQEALEKAEGFMQNMSTIMEMLRMWTKPVEHSAVGPERPRTNPPNNVRAPPLTEARAPPRTARLASPVPKAGLARKSGPAGSLKGSLTRPTSLRMPVSARAALRLRPPTPRPPVARVGAALSTAEKVVAARATKSPSPRAAALAVATSSAPATSPVVGGSASPGSAAGSPLMGPPPPPPRRHSVDSPDSPSAQPVAPAVVAGPAAARVVSNVTFATSGVDRRTLGTHRVPPVRTAPPPPPKPQKRASK